jgi:2-oxoglutarate ferredoxin oxidoreductase subunit beta
VRADNQIYLQHGKPMIFGKDRNRGLVMNCNQMEAVTIGENGITEDDLMVHNAHGIDGTYHYRLVRMGLPEFPVAMGVIRATDSSVYESDLYDQVQYARNESKIKKMDDLLRSGNVFESKG